MTREVTQADRDAAAEFFLAAGWHGKGGSIKSGKRDDEPLVQAFARHRLTAQSGEGRSGAGEDGLSAERKAVLQNPRVNDAIQTALERGELTVTMDGYLAALNAHQSGEGEREALREAHEMLRWAREALDSGYRTTRAKQEIAKINEYYAALRATDDAGGA